MTQTTHIQDCISLDPNGSTIEKPRKIEWLPAGLAACLGADVVGRFTACLSADVVTCLTADSTAGVADSSNGLGPWRRSVCAPLVLEVGVRLRVRCLVVLIVSCQKPEVTNDDT